METLPGGLTFNAEDLAADRLRFMKRWKSPDRSKQQVRDEIEAVLSEARFSRSKSWREYSESKSRLSKLVGWHADYPYFPESTDYEAAMCRLVRSLSLDSDFGRIRQHSRSELWPKTKLIDPA